LPLRSVVLGLVVGLSMSIMMLQTVSASV
jgi:hypothetical protein